MSEAWKLLGTTERSVECSVIETASRAWRLTVTFGPETMLSEIHPTENEANVRAQQLRDNLITRGWKPE
jgi:hypothetical protein